MPPVDSAQPQPYVSTAYGPPWGGIQGTGVTASGIDLRNTTRQYLLVAADPSVLPLGTKIRFAPNPFGNPSLVFTVSDTGGAIKGNRIDFYVESGRTAQLAWGRQNVQGVVVGSGSPTDVATLSGPGSTKTPPGGTAGLGGTGTQVNDFSTSMFSVGDQSSPHEDFWSAMNRLAMGRYWYPISIDTPVPTPSGWTTMGALKVGDEVFGTDGRPIRVLRVFPTQYGRECFRVSFKDGSSIVVDADHPWETTSHHKDEAARQNIGGRWLGTRTTREIGKSIFVRGQRKYNHQIPVSSPLELPEAFLPIDPYILGYWLGDGSKTNPRISVSHTDRDHLLSEIARASLVVMNDQRGRSSGSLTDEDRGSQLHLTTGVRGDLPKRLRGLGVYDNKHVPISYLRASPLQRLAVLQGLMDSDGSVGNRRVLFGNVNTRLADDTRELLRTFGLRAYRYVRKGGWQVQMPRGHVSTASDCVSIACATTPNLPLFRLPRKAAAYERELTNLRSAQHKNCHTITAVDPAPSVPVLCIEVDAPNHLFLIGEAMVPTHNCFSDTETVYLADGPDLMKQPPAATAHRIRNMARINHLGFTWDNTAFTYATTHRRRKRVQRRSFLARVTSPVEAELNWICDIDEIRAGDVVVLGGAGPGDGTWLVGTSRRSIFQVWDELQLVPALSPLSEADLQTGMTIAGVNTNNSKTTAFVAKGGATNPAPGATWSRLDQGFDGNYGPAGAIAAFSGKAYVKPVGSGTGWPGDGDYIWIVNNDQSGPNYTRAMFYAEGATATVNSGDTVQAGQTIGTPVAKGGDGSPGNFEIGPADPSSGGTLAASLGKGTPAAVAAVTAFAQWLESLGASKPTDTSAVGRA